MINDNITIEVLDEAVDSKEQLRFEDPIPELLEEPDRELNVRIDKWLWAARFYKTPALARTAVKKGYVLYGGQKVAPTQEVNLEGVVTIVYPTPRSHLITGLSTRRRAQNEAQKLYVTLESDEQNNERSFSKKVVRFLRGISKI